ncbi:MAG: hypothetical protein ABIB47_01055 [Candidatus Woesearchaeota archaeon]
MKKLFLSILVLTLIIPSILAIQSASYQVGGADPEVLKIELLSYDPSPIQPGTDFTATFRVKNLGYPKITNFYFQFVDDFPLTTNTEKIKLPDLTIGKTYTLTHDFHVDSIAETSFNLDFQYEGSFSDEIISESFTIPLETLDRNIAFDRVTVKPERIAPGESAEVTLTLQNSAPVTLTDIDIKLNFSEPFSPIKTTNERRITSLAPNGKSSVTFNVQVSPDADIDSYSLPLEITFYDTNENKFTKSLKLGLVVYSESEYELNLEESDPLIRGTSPTVTISLSDIGTSDIKFLSMELSSTDKYIVTSNPRIYLGNLEPDDFETAEYTIFLKNCYFRCPEEIPLTFRLSYKDNFNKQILDEKSLVIRTYSKREAKKFGLSVTKRSYTALYILILVILAYMTIKEYRKVKDLPKAIKTAIKKFILGILRFVVSIFRHLRWRYIKRVPRKLRVFLIKLR